RIDVAASPADERAVGFGPQGRLLYTRAEPQGRALVTTRSDGRDTRILTSAALDAQPLAVTPAGLVVYAGHDRGLRVADPDSGSGRVLDGDAGRRPRIALFDARAVVYAVRRPAPVALRVAALDGSASAPAVLVDREPIIPFAVGFTPQRRVVVQTFVSGQLDAGRVITASLLGGDAAPLPQAVLGPDGTPPAAPPADMGFEGVP